jgi:hypothetical protein
MEHVILEKDWNGKFLAVNVCFVLADVVIVVKLVCDLHITIFLFAPLFTQWISSQKFWIWAWACLMCKVQHEQQILDRDTNRNIGSHSY